MANSTRETYRLYSRYYDICAHGKVEDINLYLQLCTKGEAILEVGCGTGRVLEQLLDQGHTVTGVDICDEVLEIAAHKLEQFKGGQQFRLLNHDFACSPLNERFQKVLVTWFTFNYLIETREQSAFLANLHRAMDQEALIIMDFFYPKSLRAQAPGEKWTEERTFSDGIRSFRRHDTRWLEGAIEKRLQVFQEGMETVDVHACRRFVTRSEISSLLEGTGFREISFIDDYDLATRRDLGPGEETRSKFVVVAKK